MQRLYFLSLLIFQTYMMTVPTATATTAANLETATFGGGCFWCLEAVFERVEGVQQVISGFSAGYSDQVSYKEVCEGKSGHAEVVQLTYDPAVVSYAKLLEIFFKIHDPTTLNRQGNDVGPQYRSIILYHTPNQQLLAKDYLRKLAPTFENNIVTELVQYRSFIRAEEGHQDYYERNQGQSYCRLIIAPKVEKFEKTFSPILKNSTN